MKDIIKTAAKLFGKTIIINIMCFFLAISIVSISIALSGENANYIVYGLIMQVMSLILLASFIYPFFWDKGYKDRNMVMTGNRTADPLKGFKTGLISIIPYVLSVPVFALIKGFPVALFKMINAVYYAFFDFLTRGTDKFCDLACWKFIVIIIIFLILPVISGIGYYLGYKDFSIGEKLTYKKVK